MIADKQGASLCTYPCRNQITNLLLLMSLAMQPYALSAVQPHLHDYCNEASADDIRAS